MLLPFFSLFNTIMATLAQWLPVFYIPKQCGIATVRCYMIHHQRWGYAAFSLAIPAKRVAL
jgi:hypothetical protein